MKVKTFLMALLIALPLLMVAGEPQAAGLWPSLPSASSPITGDETIPADTNLSSGRYPQTWLFTLDQIKSYATTPSALTDGANVAVDASASNSFTLTLGTDAIGIRSINTPTELKPGQTYTFVLTQGSGGSETVKWEGIYQFSCANGTSICAPAAPTLSTTPGAKDLFRFFYDGTHMLGVGYINFLK